MSLPRPLLETQANASLPQPNPTSFASLGSFQIGVDIALVLTGILLLQVFYYFEHYSTDKVQVKAMVLSYSHRISKCVSDLMLGDVYIVSQWLKLVVKTKLNRLTSLLEVAHSIFMVHGMYVLTVATRSNSTSVHPPWSVKLAFLFSAIMDLAFEVDFTSFIK
jgi:hypothetical protein